MANGDSSGSSSNSLVFHDGSAKRVDELELGLVSERPELAKVGVVGLSCDRPLDRKPLVAHERELAAQVRRDVVGNRRRAEHPSDIARGARPDICRIVEYDGRRAAL